MTSAVGAATAAPFSARNAVVGLIDSADGRCVGREALKSHRCDQGGEGVNNLRNFRASRGASIEAAAGSDTEELPLVG